MELTRKQVIEILEKADSTVYKEPKTKTAYALEYAISSLKTDEAYQIMYEGGEIFTKADMVEMLEDLRLDFQEAELAGVFDNKELIFADEVDDLVKQKIDALKGDQAAG